MPIAPLVLPKGTEFLAGGFTAGNTDPEVRNATATTFPGITLGSTRFDAAISGGGFAGVFTAPTGTQGTSFDAGKGGLVRMKLVITITVDYVGSVFAIHVIETLTTNPEPSMADTIDTLTTPNARTAPICGSAVHALNECNRLSAGCGEPSVRSSSFQIG